MPVEVLCIVLILIVIVAIIVFLTLPKILYAKEEYRAAYIELDDVLKNRWNHVPKFIEVMKVYVVDNPKLLEEIILLRNTKFENMKFSKKIETDREIYNRMVEMSLKCKNYIDIGNDAKLTSVIETMEKLGNDLIIKKSSYNEVVEKINQLVTRFPSNIIALLSGIKKIDKL